MKNIKFRYIPCIVFNCDKCVKPMQVEKGLPDLTSTGIECTVCHSVYRVVWGKSPDETHVVLVMEGI